MIRNGEKLARFEEDYLKQAGVDYARNLAIMDAMREEAVALGVLPPEDPMEGIEVDLRVARIVNSVR
ncbi:MAG: hypothetical protein HPY75_09375 [Actinobacteria bacterium]|nr:hypothetical protein [Actinomycetota bacterium]